MLLLFHYRYNDKQFLIMSFIILFNKNHFSRLKDNEALMFMLILLNKHNLKIKIENINFYTQFHFRIIITQKWRFRKSAF